VFSTGEWVLCWWRAGFQVIAVDGNQISPKMRVPEKSLLCLSVNSIQSPVFSVLNSTNSTVYIS
jgi:hypothetical protein